MNLHNAGSLDSGPQDVLLCWLVVLGSQSVKIVKEAEKEKFLVLSNTSNQVQDVLFFNVEMI